MCLRDHLKEKEYQKGEDKPWFHQHRDLKTISLCSELRSLASIVPSWYSSMSHSSCLWRYLYVISFSFVLYSALIVTCSKVQMHIMWIFTIISIITVARFKSLARKLFVVIFVLFNCSPTLQPLSLFLNCLTVFLSFCPTIQNTKKTYHCITTAKRTKP